MLNDLSKLASDIGIELKFEKDAIELLANKSFDSVYGARPLRRTIMSLIESPLSKKILNNEISKGDMVNVSCKDNELILVSK